QNIAPQAVTVLLQHAHRTLTALHQQQIIVGDLNDTNVFFTPNQPFTSAWIDTDSYQLDRYPCPVALDSFLDPHLYTVQNFSAKPIFSTQSDWYAFAVLFMKSLLHVHPYGGMHRVYKSLRTRAEARVSLFDTAVTYPKRARPIESLSDDLLHHLHRIFEQDYRQPIPLTFLTDYANNLIACPQCHLNYPRQRTGCPTCHQQTPVPQVTPTQPFSFSIDGFIEYVGLQANGRFWCIVRQQDQYKLVRAGVGGILDEKPLFSGRSGYRFGIFNHYLVVNPPQGNQLLILDVSGKQPQRVEMIETAVFRETAVFATTPQHLYRIAGTWIMRGSVQDGHYVEDAVATAHRAQTQFWASPYTDTIAGYHRIFSEYRFFLRNASGNNLDLDVPQISAGESVVETAVLFQPDHIQILLKIRKRSQLRTEIHQFNHSGQRQKSQSKSGGTFEKMVESSKQTLFPLTH
ncbi:MAG: hypothetical protein GY943_29740, partial [Chloroflexi bacterium]|nr:hypothetical protein [Chloroflexota bacterium]